jgi:hypothetical protein
MDMEQLTKTVQWLDDERRKDKQELAALLERLAALGSENVGLTRKIQQLESDLTASTATLQRLSKIDEILDGYRKEMTRQLAELEQRRMEAEREDDRLRKLEREGVNKSLSDLRRNLENLFKLERETHARKDEENRMSRLLAELQKKVTDFNRYIDERGRALAVVEEGRRQDAKRITDLQTELSELRKRVDEARGKTEMVEDLARRTDVRAGELLSAEAERRVLQTQWVEAQSLIQAERDRAWAELRDKTEASLRTFEEYAHRVEQYAETNREIRRSADEFIQTVELLERRLGEAAEIQRLVEERFRQEWAAFLADDQKRWTTHMLLRDEQWREHERLTTKQEERVDNLEEQMAEAFDSLRQLQMVDANRLQALLNFVREMAAEYDQNYAKVR